MFIYIYITPHRPLQLLCFHSPTLVLPSSLRPPVLPAPTPLTDVPRS